MNDRDRVFLIVADELLRARLSELVASMGVGVSTFHCGLDFLAQLPRGNRGAIVCSQLLPDMDACMLLQRLQANGVHLPIVVMADECRATDVETAAAAGAWAVVASDVSSALLWRVILTALVTGSNESRATAACGRLQEWIHVQFEALTTAATPPACS